MEDLSSAVLDELLGDRPHRTFAAMLSTESEALAWARLGAPAGAVVVADYQASPRGRGGLEWSVAPGRGLGFSVVVRPDLTPQREGWLYTVATTALADALGTTGRDPAIVWPDEVVRGDRRVAAVGVHAELGPARVDWAVVTVLVEDVSPPRGPLLARILGAIEQRLVRDTEVTLEEHRERVVTLGQQVRARLVPLGPAGPEVVGLATDLRDDGALLLRTPAGGRVAVPPPHLGVLEPLGEEDGEVP